MLFFHPHIALLDLRSDKILRTPGVSDILSSVLGKQINVHAVLVENLNKTLEITFIISGLGNKFKVFYL